jgi:hypothetical protein
MVAVHRWGKATAGQPPVVARTEGRHEGKTPSPQEKCEQVPGVWCLFAVGVRHEAPDTEQVLGDPSLRMVQVVDQFGDRRGGRRTRAAH